MQTPNSRLRVVSGVQPSGHLHLGNYFGAIKQHIELQDHYPGECFIFIADFHALTTLRNAELLRQYSHDVAVDYLALGLDPSKVSFYRQSDAPQVCELMWLLSCVAGMGLLERGHAYKEKTQRGIQASVGLFTYPVLMAADILAVRATVVPVGADQQQHLEIARTVAGGFNAAYRVSLFPKPAARLNSASIVPGIDGRKMSKSSGNSITLFASDAEISDRVRRITTSPTALDAPLDTEPDTILSLFRLVAPSGEYEEMAEAYHTGQLGYQRAKALLADRVKDYIGPFRERRAAFARDRSMVEEILEAGARRVRAEIDETLRLVREVVGLPV